MCTHEPLELGNPKFGHPLSRFLDRESKSVGRILRTNFPTLSDAADCLVHMQARDAAAAGSGSGRQRLIQSTVGGQEGKMEDCTQSSCLRQHGAQPFIEHAHVCTCVLMHMCACTRL